MRGPVPCEGRLSERSARGVALDGAAAAEPVGGERAGEPQGDRAHARAAHVGVLRVEERRVEHVLDHGDEGGERDGRGRDTLGRVAPVQQHAAVCVVPHVPRVVDGVGGAQGGGVHGGQVAEPALLGAEGGGQVGQVESAALVDHDGHVAAGLANDDDVGAGAELGPGEARDGRVVALDPAQLQVALGRADGLRVRLGLEVGLGVHEERLVFVHAGLHAEVEPARALLGVTGDQEHRDVLEAEVLGRLELLRLGPEAAAGPVDDVLLVPLHLAHRLHDGADVERQVATLGVDAVDVGQQPRDLGHSDHVERGGDQLGAGGFFARLVVVVEGAAADTDLDLPVAAVLPQELGRPVLLHQEERQDLVGVGVGVRDEPDVASSDLGGDADRLASHGNLLQWL